MKMIGTVVVTDSEVSVLSAAVELLVAMSEDLPESHAKTCAKAALESLHVLCDECYYDLQNGTASTNPISADMWEEEWEEPDEDECDGECDECGYCAHMEEEEEDKDERPDRIISPNGSVFDIDNPQDIPDDVWEKMMEIILGL